MHHVDILASQGSMWHNSSVRGEPIIGRRKPGRESAKLPPFGTGWHAAVGPPVSAHFNRRMLTTSARWCFPERFSVTQTTRPLTSFVNWIPSSPVLGLSALEIVSSVPSYSTMVLNGPPLRRLVLRHLVFLDPIHDHERRSPSAASSRLAVCCRLAW